MAFEKEKPVKGLIHDCVLPANSMIKCSPCAIPTSQPASIDSLFHHHSVRADGPEESYASVDLTTAPTPSIADNTKAAPVIDDLVRNSPLFAASFTNGSITRAAHPEGWLEPFEDSRETKVKG